MYVNRIGGVMVSALVSSTVCLGFESHSALPITINGYVCFSAKHAAVKIGWFGIRIMCPSGETCLPAKLTLYSTSNLA